MLVLLIMFYYSSPASRDHRLTLKRPLMPLDNGMEKDEETSKYLITNLYVFGSFIVYVIIELISDKSNVQRLLLFNLYSKKLLFRKLKLF